MTRDYILHFKVLCVHRLLRADMDNHWSRWQQVPQFLHCWIHRVCSVYYGHLYHQKVIYSFIIYSETCVKRPLSKRPQIGFQDQLSLNVGQKYCRMLQGEHSAILSTFIKLPIVIKIFVLSIFEVLLYFKVIYSFIKQSKPITHQ